MIEFLCPNARIIIWFLMIFSDFSYWSSQAIAEEECLFPNDIKSFVRYAKLVWTLSPQVNKNKWHKYEELREWFKIKWYKLCGSEKYPCTSNPKYWKRRFQWNRRPKLYWDFESIKILNPLFFVIADYINKNSSLSAQNHIYYLPSVESTLFQTKTQSLYVTYINAVPSHKLEEYPFYN